MIWQTLIVKELTYLKDPAKRILAIKTWHIEFHMWLIQMGWRWMGRDGVGVWGRWLNGKGGEMFEHGVHFLVHGRLCLGQGSVFVGEGDLSLRKLGDGILQAFEGGLAGMMFRHGERWWRGRSDQNDRNRYI